MADIFDKFYKDVTKAIKKVKTKSEIFTESMKIKNQIKSIEEEKTTLFQELGRMAHISLQKNLLNENITKLKEKSKEIKEKEEQVFKLRQMLNDLELKEASKMRGKKAIGRCPNCGAVVYEGDEFCGVCGFKLSDIGKEKIAKGNKTSTNDEFICPNCGYKNPHGSKFCVKCGTPLSYVEGKDSEQK